jgi:hypothetical protein
MKLLRTFAIILPVALLLQACSTSDGYPSLDIRDSERVSVTMAAPDSAGFIPFPATQATIDDLELAAANALAAHQRFVAAAGGVQAPVSRAAGAAIGSEEWAVAEIEIAGLESLRSDTMLALADIDRIFVTAVVEGEEFEAATQTRDEISRMVAEQDRVIAALLATLGS